jgi:fused signal recognition particle receptor
VLDALEEVLLSADVGVGLTLRLMDDLRSRLRSLTSAQQVHEALRAQLCQTLQQGVAKADADANMLPGGPTRPQVILFVGVNGVGKTTTIGKIATQMQAQGRKVLLAAADTFRAAAAEQLEIWAQRSGAQLLRGRANADPASVVFDAIKQAQASDMDVVLADTAGRLHTKVELMDEIKKVKRAAGKARPNAPDETWLVVDATTGQNALHQAQEFHQALGLTGIILTKLDGTAKGGVVVAVVDALKIPVRYIGVGEQAADLRPFDAAAFVAALCDTAADRAA